MHNLKYPFKISRLKKEDFIAEVEAAYGLERDTVGWGGCYFNRVGSDLLHANGECMTCDWARYIKHISDEDAANFSFIEAWEWPETWKNKQMNKMC